MMEVLSKDVLTLLRDARIRETLEQVMDATADEPQERSVSVVAGDGVQLSYAVSVRESRIVTIRRLSI